MIQGRSLLNEDNKYCSGCGRTTRFFDVENYWICAVCSTRFEKTARPIISRHLPAAPPAVWHADRQSALACSAVSPMVCVKVNAPDGPSE